MLMPKLRLKILPVFLPRLGCPSHCVFCNQEGVTATHNIIPLAQIAELVGDGVYDDLAFYGGSFLSLPAEVRDSYLAVVQELMAQGKVKRLRLSTRPDSITDETIATLAPFAPAMVELGVESLSDRVLAAARRGHTAQDSLDALARLKAAGHAAVWQLMLGLPEETSEDRELTLAGTLAARPSMVRLSPTLVLEGTELAELWRSGRYQPMGLEEAVGELARWVEALEQAGISVVRMGLHPADGLFTPGEVLAGPWHPALGELVRSRIALGEMERLLAGYAGEAPVILVPRHQLSIYRGQRSGNLLLLRKRHSGIIIKPGSVDEPRLEDD
jgi:histone acetyltransferase (RNA polymerase elongator complex component)